MSIYPIKWHKISNGYDENMNTIRDRESFAFITENGAVEAWRTPITQGSVPRHQTPYYGGIEVHSKYPQHEGHDKTPGYCEWTRGDCYHDGSSLIFERIEHDFDEPKYLFDTLELWAENHLGYRTGGKS